MTETNKIAFLIPGFSDGGAQRQFAHLVNYMKFDTAFEIHVIYFYEGVNFHILEQDGIHLHRLSCKTFYDPRNVFKIARVIRREKIRLLFSWMHSCDVYSFLVSVFNKKVKWVLAERALQYPPGLVYKLRRILGIHADFIIANSEAGRASWLKEGYPLNKTSVIPNLLIPLVGFDDLPRLKRRLVIYAGRLEEAKSVRIICQAFIALSKSWPDVDFTIVGNGTLAAEIDEEIRDARVAGNVRRLPFQADVYRLFAGASVFVNVSSFEGMPNTVIENIALGTRVVLSRIPEHEAIVGHDYPFFVDLPIGSSPLQERINQSLVSGSPQEDYLFAFRVLKKMDPCMVANRYAKTFMELLK